MKNLQALLYSLIFIACNTTSQAIMFNSNQKYYIPQSANHIDTQEILDHPHNSLLKTISRSNDQSYKNSLLQAPYSLCFASLEDNIIGAIAAGADINSAPKYVEYILSKTDSRLITFALQHGLQLNTRSLTNQLRLFAGK